MKRTTGGWLTRRSVAPWDDTEPIRAEVFGRERFEQHAVSLADSHMVVAPVSKRSSDSRSKATGYECIPASHPTGPLTR